MLDNKQLKVLLFRIDMVDCLLDPQKESIGVGNSLPIRFYPVDAKKTRPMGSKSIGICFVTFMPYVSFTIFYASEVLN